MCQYDYLSYGIGKKFIAKAIIKNKPWDKKRDFDNNYYKDKEIMMSPKTNKYLLMPDLIKILGMTPQKIESIKEFVKSIALQKTMEHNIEAALTYGH